MILLKYCSGTCILYSYLQLSLQSETDFLSQEKWILNALMCSLLVFMITCITIKTDVYKWSNTGLTSTMHRRLFSIRIWLCLHLSSVVEMLKLYDHIHHTLPLTFITLQTYFSTKVSTKVSLDIFWGFFREYTRQTRSIMMQKYGWGYDYDKQLDWGDPTQILLRSDSRGSHVLQGFIIYNGWEWNKFFMSWSKHLTAN